MSVQDFLDIVRSWELWTNQWVNSMMDGFRIRLHYWEVEMVGRGPNEVSHVGVCILGWYWSDQFFYLRLLSAVQEWHRKILKGKQGWVYLLSGRKQPKRESNNSETLTATQCPSGEVCALASFRVPSERLPEGLQSKRSHSVF